MDDRLQDTVDVRQHFVIPEPQYVQALLFQRAGSTRVARKRLRIGVLPAIDFDGERGFQADEVEHVAGQRVLAAELQARELARSQVSPEQGLGVGGVGAQLAGNPHPYPLP